MASHSDIETLLSKLSTPQKVQLLTGVGWWHTQAFPELDIPALRFSDGPNGARGTRFFNGVPSSCFPSSTGMGSSFDVDLIHTIGQAIGEECRAKSTHVLLGPTVNTQRSPLGGRGFESFSEDPHLNGTIAAAYINGLQSKGVSATIKHFATNDQEFERRVHAKSCLTLTGEVSERALREIYLKPFQIAIKNSNPWALMTAYNRLNGVHASENNKLLQDILLKEWGYQGLVMSDWTGVYSTVESLKAGLDLEMPGPSVMRGAALERVLIGQKISLGDIDRRVERILRLVQRAKASGILFDGPEGSVDTPEVRKVLRTAAADSIVLLKNDKKILPLTAGYKKIAVIGPNAKVAVTSGGGSASLLSTYTVSPLEGIRAAAQKIGADVKYTLGTPSNRYLPLLDPFIHQANGQLGAYLEFWNETPTADFMSTSPVFPEKLPESAWGTPTLRSNCVLLDGVDETKVNTICWMRYSTKFTPDEDGDWELGLNIIGHGNLFIDHKLVVEFIPTVEGGLDPFNGKDIRGIAKGLKAGQEYDLEIRVSNAVLAAVALPFRCWGVIRAGGIRIVDADEAIQEAVVLAKESDVAILVIGLNNDWETEGKDREDMELPGYTNKLVSEVLLANPNTVVVNQSGTPVRMPWINEANTLLQAFYGGNESGNGLADVLFGTVNPAAKLPLTFPIRLEDNPSFLSFGEGQEPGKVHYNEGIFVGYRSYEARKLAPLLPFGYGLSYTSFEYADLKSTEISADGNFEVSFNVKNTGEVEGREVAQLYVSDRQASVPRAVKELKGFTKVNLKPGETKQVTIALDREALSFYNDREMRWTAESGKFGIAVGASSADIRLEGEVELAKTFTWTGL
ncbi:glycoside hydrolase family 3 protein [Hypholoma sublateritium FD-334 SS-4]|uniref:beta-glucosidase n=1 Tax=Hypholoma sublateritium (strain FD-334 SS-4) TaxID=945553 RepID=A0A0D2PNM7_HYPSF|nr:glycoside hydrolase family 3 protein [Hypholoma sublateritium FD-334 SS-4]